MQNNKIPWHPKSTNCQFKYQIQHSPILSASFPAFHAKDKHNYNTRSAIHILLDIPLRYYATFNF